jgi:hypothetical protein
MTKAQYTVHEIEIGQTEAKAKAARGAKASADRKPKLKTYSLDLRIHSPVSLGYFGMESVDALPALVRLAKTKGLDVIAVTDFYSSESVDRLKKAAETSGLVIIPGVDIRVETPECDDIQLTCIFPEETNSEHVARFLTSLRVPVQARGRQDFIVPLELSQVLTCLDSHGGGCFPSRMDKTPARMGAIPRLVDSFGFRSFDLAYTDSARFFQARWPQEKFNLFSFSNANALAQVGSRSARVRLEQPDFSALLQLVKRVKV